MLMLGLLALLPLASLDAFLIVPQIPSVYFTSPYTYPRLYINAGVSFFPKAGPVFSPVRSGPVEETDEDIEPATYSSRLATRNLDLCYFLGNDIFNSHVACNENWADGTAKGVKKYINELTYQANRIIGEKNLKLVWKGPYSRHDADKRYPSNPSHDTVSVSTYGCDAVIFLVFNEFSKDCKTAVNGHKYGGVNQGGMCETAEGKGYSVIVDQGYLDNVWTGPQIMAHHLLRMLIDDLPGDKTCPNKESLLHPSLYPGKQRVDDCAVAKLNKSKVSLRKCMQD